MTSNGGRTRAAWALATAAALALAGAAPVAQAAGPRPAPPAAAPACADSAPEVDAAGALAARCDREVEVLDERSEWATTFALPDGSMRLDTSIAAVRTDVSGEWEPVDASVVEGDGGLQVASAVTPMTFSDGSDGAPLARIERDGHEVVFDAPFDLPAPSVDGSQVTYDEVLPGVDLVVTVNEDATGFSEVLRVESPEAAAHPALAELTFDVETSEGIDLEQTDGGFVAADESGEPLFTSPLPTMWDSGTGRPAPSSWLGGPALAASATSDAPDPAVAPAAGADVVAMDAQVAPDAVTITPDADLLADPATQWPVFIDPGMSGSLNQRTAVRTVVGTAYNFAGDEGVGLCDRGATTTCSHTFRSRVLWQFAGLQALGNLEPSDVQSAVFAVTGTHSYSCTPMPVTLYAVSDFDAGTVYPGGGYWQPIQTHNITHRAGCGAGKEPRRIEFDATWQAQAVATANSGLASFGIAADEGSMMSWKRYAWDATFSVSYNRPPSAPVNARTTAPDSACVSGAFRPAIRSFTPVLRAVLHDPDGGNVHPRFVIDDVASGSPVWDTGWMAAQGSGAEHAVQAGGNLTEGRVYRWSVSGGDGIAASPWVSCEFTIDRTPPPMPGVDAVAGLQATYTKDATSGGIGQPGLFRFSAAGATDVDHYLFSLNSQALNMSVPGDTPQAVLTPTAVGTQTLYAQAVDRAGNVSPTQTFRFTVAPAAITDAWQLDEASGSTAVNVVQGRPPLAVSPGVARVPGVIPSLGEAEGERALLFDGPTDTAGTTTPVVRTDSFSVTAVVRADQAARAATAVSQDGFQVSGFELGLSASGCPTGMPLCWAFSMRSADSDTAPRAVATSSAPVVAGEWVQVTGTRNASSGTLQVTVCTLGSLESPGDRSPEEGAVVTSGSRWMGVRGFQLGRGLAGGAAANTWLGAVGQVRVYAGIVSIERLRTSCGHTESIPTPSGTTPAALPAAKNASGIDLDGNGKADAFWNSPNDGRWRVSFDGKTSWTAINGAGVLPSSWYRFGDVDGDGRDDVMLAPPDGRWLVSYGGTTAWSSIGQDPNAAGNVKLGDLNGDGKDDVFWAWAHDGNWRVQYAGTSGWTIINNGGGFGTESYQLADVNGDGKDDVFLAHPDGRWLVSYGGTSPWASLGQDTNAAGNVKLGDLNGDGKADVFWAWAHDGNWRVQYTGTSGWNIINNGGTLGTERFQLADMNGDGKDDVFLSNSDGRWLVSYGGTTGWDRINSANEAPGQVLVR
ncbi:VCBS repeat-containing protein [Cellulomonas sp. Sa3CUA2]|uniref:VCBS repeat-containing protein n=1 Tax=Cellulomonas avistercoris TaxID=2762242 RepID=A0ABR8QBL4_9CELL|nr:VCBS repeat-containing protein [Cellulomonas avistercoris]MBD7917824.1 VCBS repeat-containing protein [Cellulomonas avistercoris]